MAASYTDLYIAIFYSIAAAKNPYGVIVECRICVTI